MPSRQSYAQTGECLSPTPYAAVAPEEMDAQQTCTVPTQEMSLKYLALVARRDWDSGCHRSSPTQGHPFKKGERQLFHLTHRNKYIEPGKMQRQRNMFFNAKEQDKNLRKDLKETEISNLPDKEFKVMVLKILTEFGRRMDDYSEKFNKTTENTCK